MVTLSRYAHRWICIGLFFLSMTKPLFADFTLHVGPPGLGNGGGNPVSVPPLSPLDYALVYITERRTEWTLSICPGVFYGYRFEMSPEGGVYVSGGGGLALDSNGVGPAIYSAVGWNRCGTTFCFNAEYKQALGISSVLLSPYAFRIGITIRN